MAGIVGTLLLIILLLVAVVYIIHMVPGLSEALGCLKGDTSPLCLILDTAGVVTGASWAAKKLGITRKAGKAAEEAKAAGKVAEEAKAAGKVAEEAKAAEGLGGFGKALELLKAA